MSPTSLLSTRRRPTGAVEQQFSSTAWGKLITWPCTRRVKGIQAEIRVVEVGRT